MIRKKPPHSCFRSVRRESELTIQLLSIGNMLGWQIRKTTASFFNVSRKAETKKRRHWQSMSDVSSGERPSRPKRR